MEIQEILERVGLTEKEAAVYLAVLELGSATGYAIARKSDMKRPTTYMVLEALEHKRLINRVVRSGKTLFTAGTPEILLRDINKKAELAKRGLPHLLALFNANTEKPQVQMFQGKDGIREAVDRVIAAKSVRLYGTSGKGLSLYPEAAKDFTRAVLSCELTVKDILADPVAEAKYIEVFKDKPTYEIRLMKPGTIVQNDFALFGDTILLFSYRPEVFALMITGKDMAAMFESLYDLAWDAARPLSE